MVSTNPNNNSVYLHFGFSTLSWVWVGEILFKYIISGEVWFFGLQHAFLIYSCLRKMNKYKKKEKGKNMGWFWAKTTPS